MFKWMKKPTPKQPAPASADRWFCVEDCQDPRKSVVLLPNATLHECHQFIEQAKSKGRFGVYRVNYSADMKRYLQTTVRQAA